MAQNDDVAGLSDNELISQKNTLKNRLMTLREMESKNAISPKLIVEMHDVEERLNKIETRIEFRMREGQLV
jgi:hypothetical protein